MNITSLGEARFPSPVRHAVSDQARIPAEIVRDPAVPARDEVLFELVERSDSEAGSRFGCSCRRGWPEVVRGFHIPIEMLVREKKHIDPDSIWWTAVLAATGQPARFE